MKKSLIALSVAGIVLSGCVTPSGRTLTIADASDVGCEILAKRIVRLQENDLPSFISESVYNKVCLVPAE